MASKLWVGTSGYTYKHWKGDFYPKELSTSKWFEFYTQHFSTVELNVSFYRLPSKAAFRGWRKRSPEKFLFFIKGSRFITHIKKLKNCKTPLKIFYRRASALQEKSAGTLWQFPPHFKNNPDRLEQFLKNLKGFPSPRHVFEFRHESWFNPKTDHLLKKYKAVYCQADRPDFYQHLKIPDTASFVYLRRHGGKKQNAYTPQEIRQDVKRISDFLAQKKDVFIYYNNDAHLDAVKNAKKLRQSLKA